VNIHHGINCISIINILHLFLLNQIKEIKTTKYFWILVNFGLSDLIFSMFSILYFNCDVKQVILELHTQITFWISKFLIAGLGYGTILRYLVFLVSSIEKYIGVCHPYEYSTHFFINNIRPASGLIYLVGFLSSFTLGMVLELKFCWTPVTIQIISKTMKYNVVYILYPFELITLSIFITFLLVKVWKELKVTTQRDLPEHKLVISASKYIIWSYAVYQLNLLFVIVFLICQTFNFHLKLSNALEATSSILLSMYGITNVVMFIYFHPKHIDHVKNTSRFVRRSHRIVGLETIN